MITRICLAAVFGLVVLSSLSATGGNAASVGLPTIAGARQVTDGSQIGANKFKPAMCANLTLTQLVVVTGESGAAVENSGALIIGDGSQDQTLTGANRADCIVAGGAGTWIRNTLDGNDGNDVLIGGRNAINGYNGGTNTDTCYYRSHDPAPTNKQCETRILMP